MAEVEMPHPGHENHLCFLQNVGFVDNHPDDYRELLKNTQFYCKKCGRAAASDERLCEPDKL